MSALLCSSLWPLSFHMEGYPPSSFHVAILSLSLAWDFLVAQGFKKKKTEARTQKSENIASSTFYW